jgi:hypothetical protein
MFPIKKERHKLVVQLIVLFPILRVRCPLHHEPFVGQTPSVHPSIREPLERLRHQCKDLLGDTPHPLVATDSMNRRNREQMGVLDAVGAVHDNEQVVQLLAGLEVRTVKAQEAQRERREFVWHILAYLQLTEQSVGVLIKLLNGFCNVGCQMTYSLHMKRGYILRVRVDYRERVGYEQSQLRSPHRQPQQLFQDGGLLYVQVISYFVFYFETVKLPFNLEVLTASVSN